MSNETVILEARGANDNARVPVLVVCDCHRCNVCNSCGVRRAADNGLCGECIADAIVLCEERRNWQGDDTI